MISATQLPAIAELGQLDQWVISKYVEARDKDGNIKLDKPPFSPHSKRKCSHSNPAHWSSYDAARAALPGFAWLGFVFHESDPYTGIDLDGCRDPQTGTTEAWAQRIIDQAQSYTEISPSGTGVKIFVRGKLTESIKHSLGSHKGIEIYSRQRYFTVTGQHLAGTPTTIREAQAQLEQLQQELKPLTPEPPKVERAIGVINIKPRASAGRASLDDVKARFNSDHSLPDLLASYGAVQTEDGYTCPFCTHTHKTTLHISKKGRLFSYSPNCKLYTTKGYDAFGLYVLIEHNDNALAAAKKLNPIEPRQKRQHPPLVEPETRQQAYNAERRAQRQAETRQALDSLYDQVCTLDLMNAVPDGVEPEGHSARAHLLFAYLHQRASEAGVLQVAPTNERLATDLDMCKRYVIYAFRELEATGIGKRSGGKSGLGQPNEAATWTFYRTPNLVCKPQQDAECTLSYRELDLVPTLELVSRAPQAQPAAEPAEWECWQPAEWECSGYVPALESDADEAEPIAVLQAAPEPPKVEQPRQEAKTATVAVLEPEDADGGAAYIPELDQIEPLHAPKRSRAKKSPIEAAAVAKSRRQARWRAMEAPELRKNLIVLSRKADKTPNPAQRYALKEQCAEIQHYLAIKDAWIDVVAVVAPRSQAPGRRPAVAQQQALL